MRGRKQSTELAKKRTDDRARLATLREAAALNKRVFVNPALLRPDNSYGTPEFVQRGYYVDLPFTCRDCGKQEIWTATQQKWWYESAKGGVWTTAIHCRPCRRKEQARKAEARRVHLEGLSLKRRTIK
jgi:hypothetical protein